MCELLLVNEIYFSAKHLNTSYLYIYVEVIKFMKHILIILIVLLLTSLVIADDCVTEIPEIIDKDITLCKQEFNIDYTIQINSGIKFNCDSASLIGDGTNTGFLLKQTKDSEIMNCNLANFQSGFYLDNAENNLIVNNYIYDSKEYSMYMINSNGNLIYNNEINTPLSYDNLSENDFCVEYQQNKYEGVIGPGCEEPVEIDNYITGELLDNILDQISEAKTLDKVKLIDDYKKTLSKIKIDKTFSEKEVKIKISFKEKSNFNVYEYIPKDTLESTDLIDTTNIDEVLNKDPLLMWSFVNVDAVEVSYGLPDEIAGSPKTIVIETVTPDGNITIDYPDDLNNRIDDSDDEGADNLQQSDNKKSIGKKKPSKLNATFTMFILIIICIVVIYLIKKKW